MATNCLIITSWFISYCSFELGTLIIDPCSDGTTQQLAGCLRDFRNKPFPTRAKVTYHNNILTLMYHNGMSSNEQDFELCFRAENVVLPKNGYFGVSAATGGLADDHDVIHFLTSSFADPGATAPDPQGDFTHFLKFVNLNSFVIFVFLALTEDQQKLQQEYLDYQRKLEQQKDDYRKEHPDDVSFN